MEYKYITENNLENPQTYMYSEFAGHDFLKSYFATRDVIANEERLDSIEDIKMIFLTKIKDKTSFLLLQLYENLQNEDYLKYKEEVDFYVKKFEVKKRLYGEYDSSTGKIIEESGYNEQASYLLLALVTIHAYEKSKCLKYLNCLLKVVDTLLSLKGLLSEEYRKILSIIAEKEKKYILQLLRDNEVIMEE